jgi:site-specific recombinase XerD
MSKSHLVRSAKIQSMNPGPLRPFVDAFADHLFGLGHTRLTVRGYQDSARHFADWLRRSNIELAAINDDVFARFSNHHCRCPGTRRSDHLSKTYINRVRRFIRFLTTIGVVSGMTPRKPTAISPQVAEFQDWLRRHRGISERTIDRHGRMITRLLPALGDDSARYDASLIRRVILDEAQKNTPVYAKTMTTALRGYLKFLAARSACPPWLDQAVPTIPQWRLSALPRYLPAAEVEKLIASCELTQAHGIRDRAILLLLARLGLRAGDILDLRLDDIAWAEGALRVRGKGRQEICLPLPQDVGDALLDYLHRARPSINDSRIFLRSRAPYQPFTTSTAISHVVQRALNRAGITDAPSRGAHLLRHSAATTMLRQGASLDTVGTILRHRSADTTAHYAKVDIVMLREVAQPWPEAVSC